MLYEYVIFTAHFAAESIKFQDHIVELPDLQGFHWHVLSWRSAL